MKILKIQLAINIGFMLLFCLHYSCKKDLAPKEKIRIGNDKKVGIAYTTWHRAELWNDYWGTPELGKYLSNNRKVIKNHGEWLAYAGVDFIFIDWSNNIDYVYGVTQGRPDFDMIENTVPLIFQEWKDIKNAPKISIMLGCPDQPEAFKDGRIKSKLNQIYNQFITNDHYKDQYYNYLGKPLVIIYVGTPTPFTKGIPNFNDERFTLRYMTGFITEQPYLVNNEKQSIYGYWSWEDRGNQTYSLYGNEPKTCTITAASREQSGANYVAAIGRMNGETFKNRWKRAVELDVHTALVVSWNEWVKGEQPSIEVSKDIEPSKEHGKLYLEILKTEISKFKNTK